VCFRRNRPGYPRMAPLARSSGKPAPGRTDIGAGMYTFSKRTSPLRHDDGV
jgi:hypothetical protein